MSKRKILTLALGLCMVAILAVGGTLAYFTDTDNAKNVFTLGNVKIKLHEGSYDKVQKNGAPVDADGNLDLSKANPNNQEKNGYFGYDYLDEEYRDWLENQLLVPGTQNYNRIQKRIFVENTGNNAAYVRVWVGIPAALDDPNNASNNILHCNQVTGPVNNNLGHWIKDGQFGFNQDGYNFYVYYYTEAVAAGESTNAEAVSYFYLDEKVDHRYLADGTVVYTFNGADINYDLSTGKIEIPVYAEAIQADGFDTYTDAWAKYGDASFKN